MGGAFVATGITPPYFEEKYNTDYRDYAELRNYTTSNCDSPILEAQPPTILPWTSGRVV